VRGVGEFPFSQNEVVGAVLGREDAWLDLLQKRFWQVREDRKLFQLLDREKVLRRLEGMGKRAGNRAGVGGFTWVQPLTPLRASRSDVRPRKAKSQCFDSLRVRTKTRTLSACCGVMSSTGSILPVPSSMFFLISASLLGCVDFEAILPSFAPTRSYMRLTPSPSGP